MPVKLKLFQAAKDVSKVQAMMKDSLKAAAGKGDVKFVAARNYKIGSKFTSLFLVVDTSTQAQLFLAHIKQQGSMVVASTGVAAVTKEEGNTHKVLVKQATGGLSHTIISTLVKPALGNDGTFAATTPERAQAEIDHPPTAPQPPSKPGKVRPSLTPQTFLKPAPKPQEGGVGDWAKTEYQKKAKKTLIASQTPGGEIGSIYFGGKKGRIRTTHGLGPEKKQHKKGATLQYNVIKSKAKAEYEKEKAAGNVPEDTSYNRWLAERLNDTSNIPSWAKLVDSPKTARDVSKKGLPSNNTQLFEIFQKVNGDVENWHPSRGAAVKFETDKQTLAVLEAAIKEIDSRYPVPRPRPSEAEQKKLYKLRNKTFYDFVTSRLPQSELVKAMRDPGQVKVYAKLPKTEKTETTEK